ncbi:MAG: hypothetical protein J5744_04265 [Oscillospiraceae bacterium]|nr:hypothetical protein [Oscillospiraceae bacterium]
MLKRKSSTHKYMLTAIAVTAFLTVCAAESIIKTKEAIRERDRKIARLRSEKIR